MNRPEPAGPNPIVPVWLAAALALCCVARPAASGPWTSPDAVVSSEFLYERAPFPACHASTLAETPEGLVAAWFGGTHERHPDVGIWFSHRNERGWTPPVEIATGESGGDGSGGPRLPTWNPVLYQAPRGPLVLFYKVGPSPSQWWGMRKVSDDGGRTWSEPERLPADVLGPVKNKPILLPSGELLCPSSSEGDGWRVHFEFTRDLGKTWRRTAAVNDPAQISAIQPSVLAHRDGRLQAVGRTRSSGVFQVWSEDGGETWGPMTTTGLPNPSSGTDAVTLADGRFLLVYNHNSRYKGRSPLNVALSSDGLAWRAALVLEDDPQAPDGFAYPAVIQTRDGMVHISYTWRRERIRHVVVDPAKLRVAPIVDGAWPDAEVNGGTP